MNITIISYTIVLIIGILINIFMKKLVIIVFKKDGSLPRIPLRFIGVYLVINSISHLFHI